MSSWPSARARTLARSVLPTPAGPSTRIGFLSAEARYTTGAIRRGGIYFLAADASITSSIDETIRPPELCGCPRRLPRNPSLISRAGWALKPSAAACRGSGWFFPPLERSADRPEELRTCFVSEICSAKIQAPLRKNFEGKVRAFVANENGIRSSDEVDLILGFSAEAAMCRRRLGVFCGCGRH